MMAQERISGPSGRRPELPGLSVAILAGGASHGMDPKISMLTYRGAPIVSVLVDEMRKVSSEVIVLNGSTGEERFATYLDGKARLVPDEYQLNTPLGGILSAFPHLSNPYVAFISCDMPFVKSELVSLLHRSTVGRSAAIPLGKDTKPVPLCGVYSVRHAEEAGLKALSKKMTSAYDMVNFLDSPNYLGPEQLRGVDPNLVSLVSVTSQSDLDGRQ